MCIADSDKMCGKPDCPVFNNLTNQLVEYQMYMSQHLQYFGLQGSLGIFDPMVRKQIFNVANKVYCGQEIIPGIGPRIPVADTKQSLYKGLIKTNNLYFNLTRPFGYGKKVGALMSYKPGDADPG